MEAKFTLNINARYWGWIVIGRSDTLRHMKAPATG